MRQYDCVIIDSGVNLGHRLLKTQDIQGVSISIDEGGAMVVSENFQDSVGHGTAIYSIINRHSPNMTSIFNINIFEKKDHVDEKVLLAALRYVYQNIQCKVINISMGLKMCDNINSLHNICKNITDRGTYILSAFDNDGGISYPAAFDCVIGVDSSEDCVKVSDYEYVENSVVNILAKGGYHKLLWLEPEYVISQGSSFSCAYMSANVMNLLSEIPFGDTDMFFDKLKSGAKEYHPSILQNNNVQKSFFTPNSVVLFPFNKEIHSLIAFRDLLPFNIYATADLRQSGNVGKNLGEVITYTESTANSKNRVIDFDSLVWEDTFDTIVLGHVELLEKLTKRNLLHEVIQLSIKYGKNLICFDDISKYSRDIANLEKTGCRVYYPKCFYGDLPCNQFGKLHLINKPVICIAGTSRSQGKFSLQLALREKLINDGYKIGQLGTEPTSLLYGMDEVFHYGYSVTNNTCFEETVLYVNHLMHKIEKRDPDIIITGVQSGLVPYICDNISYLTHRQIEVITGIMPDVIILCINVQDDINYINRTVLFVENFLHTTVLCCALYPMKYSEQLHTYNKMEQMEPDELLIASKEISEQIKIPVFPMDKKGIQSIYDAMINYFSE